jgi:hypothetical protein
VSAEVIMLDTLRRAADARAETIADARDALMECADLLISTAAVDRIPHDEADSLKMISETLLGSARRLLGMG